jgi:hypothetical protein
MYITIDKTLDNFCLFYFVYHKSKIIKDHLLHIHFTMKCKRQNKSLSLQLKIKTFFVETVRTIDNNVIRNSAKNQQII